MMDPANFQRFSKRGAVLGLNQFFDSAPDKVSPRFDIKNYYPSIVKAHSLDGQVYVLPRDIAPMSIIYYNKSMLRKVGLEKPPEDWTWDFVPHPEKGNHDFLTLLQNLQKKNADGKVVGWGYVPGWQDLLTDWVVYSTGAYYTDDPANPTKCYFDDPRIIKAFQFSADLTLKEKLAPSSFDQAGTSARQIKGKKRNSILNSRCQSAISLRRSRPSRSSAEAG
jgi:ABC-type glycerol-3-phosphate transport system substrate-binding protein